MNKYSILIFFFAATSGFSIPSLAQQSGVGFGNTGGGGGTVLEISANGTCWDDCWVESTPLGDGTIMAIMKGGQVVDQGYVDAPLDVQGDDPGPPPSGTGSRSDSFHSSLGTNAAGQEGRWVTTITYTYMDHRLRNTTSKTEWVPAMDPPADGGEG